jgi:hypothetical protein
MEMSKEKAPRELAGALVFYEPPAFLGAETLLPFLADEIFLFTIKDEPFACEPPPLLFVTIPEAAAFFGGFVFDLLEFDFAIVINLAPALKERCVRNVFVQ